jgi:hypothetical protein
MHTFLMFIFVYINHILNVVGIHYLLSLNSCYIHRYILEHDYEAENRPPSHIQTRPFFTPSHESIFMEC